MQSAVNGRQRGLTLIELLVTIVIMSVVTTMLVMVFIDLQGAYSFTSNSDHAREDARQAMALMVTEIRDAQIPTTGPYAGQPPLIYASSNDIRFYTSYGTPGGTGTPILTHFRYRLDSSTGLWTLFEQRDTNGNDTIDNGDERLSIATDIVNHDPTGDGNQDDRKDVFTYSYYDANDFMTTGATYSSTGTVLTGTTSVPAADSINIISVGIRIIADLNPGRAPVYFDLQTEVQPRNLGH